MRFYLRNSFLGFLTCMCLSRGHLIHFGKGMKTSRSISFPKKDKRSHWERNQCRQISHNRLSIRWVTLFFCLQICTMSLVFKEMNWLFLDLWLIAEWIIVILLLALLRVHRSWFGSIFSNWIHIILLESVEMFICMNIHYDRITVMIICCCDESFLEHREEGKICSPKGRCWKSSV